jgi:hypothetical protein
MINGLISFLMVLGAIPFVAGAQASADYQRMNIVGFWKKDITDGTDTRGRQTIFRINQEFVIDYCVMAKNAPNTIVCIRSNPYKYLTHLNYDEKSNLFSLTSLGATSAVAKFLFGVNYAVDTRDQNKLIETRRIGGDLSYQRFEPGGLTLIDIEEPN